MRSAVILTVALSALAGFAAPAKGGAGTSPFSDPWIDGTHGAEPELQVQQYDADTYILRQSVRTNVEAPFLFLFFGTQKVLLVDTGAGGLKIRPTIDKLISQWVGTKGLTSIQLVIAHSHAHGDHIAGDGEFTDRPDTQIVGHSPGQVAAFFNIHSWPEDLAALDLGGRVLDIIPSPGHEPAEISVYDRQTHLLLMGDELYPGRLYIPADEFATYKKTIDRITDFTRGRPVAWILGNHIEMTLTPGRDYALHALTHPNEHPLQLPYARLLELHSAIHKMGERPRLEIHPDFIIYPLP